MKQRGLAALLACVLLAGCGANQTMPPAEEPKADGPVIAYVPLDDRPDNVGRVVYLAESLGYQVAMPEADDYRTRLDGQPLNENGTQRGDREALFDWVFAQETAGCDRYILSMDQLMSGGLVHSRSEHLFGELSFTDEAGVETVWGETEAMGHLLSVLAADEKNQVWLLDSVMRLASTVGYQGGTLEQYNAARAYGAEPRPELTGEQLTLGNVIGSYELAADGTTMSHEDFGLTAEQAVEYRAARERKLILTYDMMEIVTGIQAGNLRVLIGIDDSSEENSIQKNEIAYLRSLLREGDALLSGVDDMAFKAVTKLYLDEIGWTGASVSVEYFGGTEDQPACAYDYQPLTHIVEEHFGFFNLTEAEPGSAEMRMLVLTQPAEESNMTEYCDALIRELNTGRKDGVPVILVDAGNGRYGTAFHEMLTEQTELGALLSYSGFLDMAIVTGTALSHGLARYAFLHHGEQTDVTERAFLRTLADSILKDFCYKHIVRNDILNYVRGDLGGSADNFWQPDIPRDQIVSRLTEKMDEAVKPVIKNLEQSSFISALPSTREYAERDWGSVDTTGYYFPWDRAFEIEMEILLGELPH